MLTAKTKIKVGRSLPITDIMAEKIRGEVLEGINAYMDSLESTVPIWSGRLRSSFHTLGDKLVNEGVRNRPFSRGAPQPKESARVYFAKNNKLGQLNQPMGGKTKVRLPRKAKSQFTFTFDNQVPYYGPNDTTTVGFIKSTPWHSQEQASQALVEHVAGNLPNKVSRTLVQLVDFSLTASGKGIE